MDVDQRGRTHIEDNAEFEASGLPFIGESSTRACEAFVK